MSNEEYTKECAKEMEAALQETTAEETVETTAEETAEETAVDSAETAGVLEEETVEAVATEEASAEDIASEAPTPEETSVTEETPVTEEATGADAPKKAKKKKGLIVLAIVAAVLLVALVGGYIGISMHYKERFFAQTMVNGTDCSGKTIEEVEAVLQSQVEEYVLTILEASDKSEQIKGTDIDITYVGYHQIQEAFAEQNPYLWPESIFNDREIKADIEFTYNQEKLDAMILALECLKPENQTAPVAATVVYQDGQFVIREEVYGTQLDAAKVSEAIHRGVTDMQSSVSLVETDCYIQPTFTKDSEAVIAAKDEMNKYLTASITYSLDNIEVTVNKDTFATWISADANMTPTISAELAKKFTDTLGSKYNTPGRSGVLVTPTGKEVLLSNAAVGRTVGSKAESEQLISDIKSGQTITRAPILSQTATPEGQTVWGSTYVEVDITEQHMWYIVDGAVVFETDVVTGKKGKNDTPTGIFAILEKDYKRVLRGRPLANGKPSYLTPVDYWMRVTWSGIGFHDASWQPTFGGTRYVTNGSHGCINMPPAKAKELFGMISLGLPVVIHY